jgi:hypothetical protein
MLTLDVQPHDLSVRNNCLKCSEKERRAEWEKRIIKRERDREKNLKKQRKRKIGSKREES